MVIGHENGKLVLGESIGDLGGAKIAFRGLGPLDRFQARIAVIAKHQARQFGGVAEPVPWDR